MFALKRFCTLLRWEMAILAGLSLILKMSGYLFCLIILYQTDNGYAQSHDRGKTQLDDQERKTGYVGTSGSAGRNTGGTMRKRMSAEERRHQLLSIMQELHQSAKYQADFTAKKIAQIAGISTVMFYRLVRLDFQTLRSQLPGPRRPYDEVVRNLRLEIIDLRRQLREAKAKLRATAVEELDQAWHIMQELEKENLQLRDENKLLRQRLREGGQVVVSEPVQRTSRANLSVVNSEKAPTQNNKGNEG